MDNGIEIKLNLTRMGPHLGEMIRLFLECFQWWSFGHHLSPQRQTVTSIINITCKWSNKWCFFKGATSALIAPFGDTCVDTVSMLYWLGPVMVGKSFKSTKQLHQQY